jgi:hypothetical protein
MSRTFRTLGQKKFAFPLLKLLAASASSKVPSIENLHLLALVRFKAVFIFETEVKFEAMISAGV